MTDEITVLESTGADIYHSEEKAVIDIQIATAKAYPRDIRRAVDDAIAVATMDKGTAETCNYTLPRGGKNISGPSVHLARIIAQEWGNIRVDSKVVDITNSQVICQAVCFDLQKNYAVKVEVRKNILQNVWENGRMTGAKARMNDDMITVTGNAANAIAFRNAVFAVIPKSVTDKVYSAAKNMLTGDLSSEEKLIKRRKQALDTFRDDYKVSEEQILEVLKLNSVNQIKQDEIMTLIGLYQAIKDGDTTVSDTFGATKKAERTKTTKIAEDIMSDINKGAAKKPAQKDETKKEEPVDDTAPAEMKFKDLSEARAFL